MFYKKYKQRLKYLDHLSVLQISNYMPKFMQKKLCKKLSPVKFKIYVRLPFRYSFNMSPSPHAGKKCWLDKYIPISSGLIKRCLLNLHTNTHTHALTFNLKAGGDIYVIDTRICSCYPRITSIHKRCKVFW